MSLRPLLVLAVVATMTLAACESSEEKADAFYQSGLALLASGDTERAAIEFRNVFRYDGTHREARRELAQILMAKGDVSGAYGQYLRLAEQYPEAADIRRDLAVIAIDQGQWTEAERHGREAVALDPAPEEAQSIRVALDYRQASIDEDAQVRAGLATEARALLETAPDDLVARRIVIAEVLAGDAPGDALPDIEEAIRVAPGAIQYAMLKLQVLGRQGDDTATGAWLQEMYARFPDNADVQQTLISWYLQQKDFDGAEAFLRGLAGPDDGVADGATDSHVTVVRLIETARGRDAAVAELDRLIAANAAVPANAAFYASMKAAYAFQDGDRDGAIAQLQAILTDAQPSPQTQRIRGMLARMLLATGNPVGARALVEEVLAEDQSDVTALKLRAQMLIDADAPDDAILDLRRALDQDPRDTETILLLADAHARDGNTDLEGERLATAVEVSNAGATESLRYAGFLLQQNRRSSAAAVLAAARAANPGSVDLIAQSARLSFEDGADARVRRDIDTLNAIPDDPRAAELATSLETALALRQNRVDDGIALLEQQAQGGRADAVLALVRTQMQAGDVAGARRSLDAATTRMPDDPGLRMIDAGLSAAEGDLAGAEATLRDLIATQPGSDAPAQQLYRLLSAQGRAADATAVLDAGLAALPDSRLLRLFKAAELERDGDIDGAITVYEALYAENSADVVIANNLASLLASHSDDADAAALARAEAVARRLRGTTVPAFQDTYGWIAYRLDRPDEALGYLEPAAAGLPADPLVQYHLGMAYAALGRNADASRQLTRALDLAGDNPLPQFDTARSTLADLAAANDGTGDGTGDGTSVPGGTGAATGIGGTGGGTVDGDAGNGGTGGAGADGGPTDGAGTNDVPANEIGAGTSDTGSGDPGSGNTGAGNTGTGDAATPSTRP
jgi:tetratricopeptide (TPR) repeat protein